jgi:integrase
MNPVENYIFQLKKWRRSKEYIKSMSYVLNQFNDLCDQKEVDILAANEDILYLFVDRLEQEKKAESTLNLYVKSIVRFYDYIVDSEKYELAKNPMKSYSKQTKFKTGNHSRPLKDVQEISQFMRKIHPPRDRAIIILFAKTGIRNGELVALNIDDLDLDKNVLTIDKHVDDKTKNTITSGRKNGNISIIPIDDETKRALQFYLAIRLSTNNEKALFTTYTGKRMYENDISRLIKKWTIKTELCIESNDFDKKMVPHYFRGWLTFQLQINGCNPYVIDKIRGDKPKNTRDYYSHQFEDIEYIREEYLRTVPQFGI